MQKTFLIITSIAQDNHPILNQFAKQAVENNFGFILIGDKKSPQVFNLPGCDFYSAERQVSLGFSLSKDLPFNHYGRKNLGYLQAIKLGANCIVETDDDNIPYPQFWEKRMAEQKANTLENSGWVNVYRFFTEENIWPRGLDLERITTDLPLPGSSETIHCPIQQGLADDNPDVDAIYRLAIAKPVKFEERESIALKTGAICPFNSQNTTWFLEAFPLLYLPSYCSFRMTDIWRSFVAQRIAWTCNWPLLFHKSTVRQERNIHNLINDFKDEVSGYLNNAQIMKSLSALNLKSGVDNIPDNMRQCYSELIGLGLIGAEEMGLLNAWIDDLTALRG